jgi:hypothetical protein
MSFTSLPSPSPLFIIVRSPVPSHGLPPSWAAQPPDLSVVDCCVACLIIVFFIAIVVCVGVVFIIFVYIIFAAPIIIVIIIFHTSQAGDMLMQYQPASAKQQ